MYLGTQDLRGVGEYTDARLRKVVVPQTDGVVDNLGEMGMQRRLAVARKGEDIWSESLGCHLLQTGFQGRTHLLAGGHLQVGTMPGVEAALTIDAVERTHLAVGRKQVDTQRNT